jgi:hypothetical protein
LHRRFGSLLVHAVGRAFQRLGLERRARDVTLPSPLEYAAMVDAQDATENTP